MVACCILVCFLVFVQFCGWSGGSAQLHFLHRHCVLVNWVVSFAVICMVLCISNLGYVHTHGSHYTTYTLTGCYSSPSLHERPLKITKRCVLLPWCPTLLQSSCPSLHIRSSLWWLVTPMLPLCVCVYCKHASKCVYRLVSHRLPVTPHYLPPAVRRRWPMV